MKCQSTPPVHGFCAVLVRLATVESCESSLIWPVVGHNAGIKSRSNIRDGIATNRAIVGGGIGGYSPPMR